MKERSERGEQVLAHCGKVVVAFGVRSRRHHYDGVDTGHGCRHRHGRDRGESAGRFLCDEKRRTWSGTQRLAS